MHSAYIYPGIRTPFGRYAGVLASLRPDDMAAETITRLAKKGPFPADQVTDVILGCSNQGGEDSRNVARNAALLAGLPIETSGVTVNRLCASGLEAVWQAAKGVVCEEGNIYIAGGVESMTRAPLVMNKAASPFDRSMKLYDSTIGFRFPNLRFLDSFGDDSLAQTADNIAAELAISREEADAFACRSQERYEKARVRGFFEEEITPISLAVGKKGETMVVDVDEQPRPETNCDELARLRTVNTGGIVTAGNASSLNDGACAMWVASRKAAGQYGAGPGIRVVAAVAAGVPPRVMGYGPVPAITKVLEKAGLTLADMGIIEINEAFAPQVLGCLNKLGIAYDDSRVNPNGGAIAVGHPLGASGTRIALTTCRHMLGTGIRYGVISLCIGLGQGLAMLLENEHGRK